MTVSPRILIVDDEPSYAEMLSLYVRSTEAGAGAAIDTAASYDDAIRALATAPPDLAFVDYLLGARDGVALLGAVRAKGVETPIIILTGHGAEDVAVRAMKAGAADYLAKTQVSIDTLDRAIRHALALGAEERQRRQAERALRASEERFRALVEHSSDALLLVDIEGRIQYMTPSSSRHVVWKPDEVHGRSIFDILHPDDRPAVASATSDALTSPGQSTTLEVRVRQPGGSVRTMEAIVANHLDDPSVGSLVVTARDITERRRLEDQLRHAQKMEAVGELAGGIAHDFTNLLTAILGYCNLVLEDMPQDDPRRHDLEEIRAAGERATSLTNQLLAFARRQVLQPQVVDVNLLVKQLQRLLRRIVTRNVELDAVLDTDLAMVKVDPTSIEQVLVNLAVHACDTMPDGGRLTIETSNVVIGVDDGGTPDDPPPGRYVLLAVCDNGAGMDAETRARIFEPFFTTVDQSKRSGLGLATVYGIVKQNGGYVSVESEPGAGTAFKVFLPRAESVMVPRTGERSEQPEKKRGWETVLLVEDDDAVRALAREVLHRHGYAVLEARHGVDALRVAERHRDAIHMIITDLVTPRINGRDLADRLTTTRPDMKVLFLAGQTTGELPSPDVARGSAIVRKPFTPDALARKVRVLLDN